MDKTTSCESSLFFFPLVLFAIMIFQTKEGLKSKTPKSVTTVPTMGSEKTTPWGVVLKPVPRKRFSDIVLSKQQESIELTTMESKNQGSQKTKRKFSSKTGKNGVAVEVKLTTIIKIA